MHFIFQLYSFRCVGTRIEASYFVTDTNAGGGTKVSHMANKKMKRYLHMASLTGIKLDEGLKAYYERKVIEGKNKMSVLNAIRNKLLARIFAVVNRGSVYQKINY